MKQIFFRPVYPFVINQQFGDNRACISDDGKRVITPTSAVCPVGFRSVYSQMKGHNGLDLMAYSGQPVHASFYGEVVEVEEDPARGLGVGIYHDLVLDGKWKTRYWHLKTIAVKLGQIVNTGDIIGYADNTGYSSGDHLHFEVKPQKQKYENLDSDNGYFGAVDPMPLLLPDFAAKQLALQNIINAGGLTLVALKNILRVLGFIK